MSALVPACSPADVPIDADCLIAVFSAAPRPWPDSLIIAYLRYIGICRLHDRRFWIPSDVSPRVLALSCSDHCCIGRSALAHISGRSPHVVRRLLADPAARFTLVGRITDGPF